MFPNGVGKYVDLMEDLIPEMKGGTIRTAIDTGCGVSLTLLLFVFILGIEKFQFLKFLRDQILSLIMCSGSFSCNFLTVCVYIYFKIN